VKRHSAIARVWLGVMSAATVLAVAWFFYVRGLAGVALYDLNSEALRRLSESEGAGVVRTAQLLMFSSAAPPLLLSVAWAITAIVLLRRRSTPE
jgi:hypothetical protein